MPMKKLSKSQVDNFYAIAGSSIIASGGLAYAAYHVSKMTQVVMVAGTVPVDGALESMQFAVDGVPYTLSVVPAVLGMKIFVGGLLVVMTVIVAWKVYHLIKAKRELNREKKHDPSTYNMQSA